MVYNIKGSGGRIQCETAQKHLDFYALVALKLWRSSVGAEGGAIEQCYDAASEKGTASPEHVPEDELFCTGNVSGHYWTDLSNRNPRRNSPQSDQTGTVSSLDF